MKTLLFLLIASTFPLATRNSSEKPNMIEDIKAPAKAGNAEAQLELAKCYKNGNGVTKDDAEAVTWCRKAADQGLVSAYLNLGTCYELGEGVERDVREAVKWYRKARRSWARKGSMQSGALLSARKGRWQIGTRGGKMAPDALLSRETLWRS